MNRRAFLKTAWIASGAGITARAANPKTASTQRPNPKSFELEEWTVSELQAALDSGRFTAVDLTRRYLARIDQIDRKPEGLASVIELNPDAIAIAGALDRERKTSGRRGPLHGIPVLIKDNIATRDRMSTTAGSLALLGSVPPRDSFVAQQLRNAGAVIMGKTNLSEWANFRSSRSTSGWSGRGGLTRNPYVLNRNPSGSSSGSGVAVSANLCALAVGTETDGSILSPASVNGIVGLKPTVGLVSRSGIIPIAHSQDTAGPMTRSVTDTAILLSVLAGEDSRDPVTQESAGRGHKDYTRFLDANGLRGARIGVVRKLFRGNSKSIKLAEAALEQMRQLGAILVDPADLPSHGQIGSAEMEVLLYEFKTDLNAYLSELEPGSAVRTLKEIIAFNERNRDKEMPYFEQETLVRAEAKGPLTEQAYLDARDKCRRLSRDEGIDAVVKQHQLDALVAPSTGPAAVTDLVYGDRDLGGSSQPAAVAGYPSITVPAGFVSELPVGISFFGQADSEPALLKFAYAFEQATHARRAPQLLRE